MRTGRGDVQREGKRAGGESKKREQEGEGGKRGEGERRVVREREVEDDNQRNHLADDQPMKLNWNRQKLLLLLTFP